MVVVEKNTKFKNRSQRKSETVNSASYQEVVTSLETQRGGIQTLLNNGFLLSDDGSLFTVCQKISYFMYM